LSAVNDQGWRKPAEIPNAPRLTKEYLKSCGIELEKGLQESFGKWP